jgi:hypothetical protein
MGLPMLYLTCNKKPFMIIITQVNALLSQMGLLSYSLIKQLLIF